jgi:signal transduction histidine kinase
LKAAFLRNVNHKLRNPLNVILGNVELLMEAVADPEAEAQRALKAIANAVMQLERSLRAIIDISSIETGAFSVAPTMVKVADIIREQMSMIETQAERKGIKLLCEIADPEIEIRIDSYCLSHALRNLFDNALKYTERGHILVRLTVGPNSTVQIDVIDTGPGIRASDLPRLFRPFSRQSDQNEELGLGLSLAQRYLALSGASLSLNAAGPAGSVFTIKLQNADRAV